MLEQLSSYPIYNSSMSFWTHTRFSIISIWPFLWRSNLDCTERWSRTKVMACWYHIQSFVYTPGASASIDSHSFCSWVALDTLPVISDGSFSSMNRTIDWPFMDISLGIVTMKSGTHGSIQSRDFFIFSSFDIHSRGICENLNLLGHVWQYSVRIDRVTLSQFAMRVLHRFSHCIIFPIESIKNGLIQIFWTSPLYLLCTIMQVYFRLYIRFLVFQKYHFSDVRVLSGASRSHIVSLRSAVWFSFYQYHLCCTVGIRRRRRAIDDIS